MVKTKKFGYKKYLKPKQQKKDLSTLKVFACSFVLMLVVFTVLINCFAPEVDVSIGDASSDSVQQEDEAPVYLKKYVDNRLLAIQQEDLGQDTKKLSAGEKSVKIIEAAAAPEAVEEPVPAMQMKPVELQIVVPEINVAKTGDVVEKIQAPVPQPVVNPEITATYRVYIGHYTTYDQVKIAKDIVNETDPALNAVIKELNTGYTLQAGVFKNKEAATELTNNLLKEHLPARMIVE